MIYVILGDLFTFPEGDAATNRVYSYAKGLVENGIEVHVICFKNIYTEITEGLYDGIHYYNVLGEKKKDSRFVVRNWKKLKKYFRTIRLLKSLNRKDKIKVIIVYSALPGTFMLSRYAASTLKSKVVQEISEHPIRHYREDGMKYFLSVAKVKVESGFTDGIICISKYLVDYFRKNKVPPHRLFLLPSTVDPSRFKCNGQSPFPFRYIGYFGGLTFHRDNVDNLVRAFAIIEKKHPDIHLVLGGFCSRSERVQLLQLITDVGIQRCKVLDYLSRDEIVKYIINAHLLVMVRADDLKAQASFPSKLSEYLATSKPVITVKVGEIPDYLTDGVDVFMVEPGDSIKLAEKIDIVLNNYPESLKVAERGKRLTAGVFNYRYQAKRMIRFIDSLYKL